MNAKKGAHITPEMAAGVAGHALESRRASRFLVRTAHYHRFLVVGQFRFDVVGGDITLGICLRARRKTPAEVNANAVRVARIAIGETEKPRPKNPAAVALGRLGASKGGNARAAALSAMERSAIARKAAESGGTRNYLRHSQVTDKEHVARISELVYSLDEAVVAARKDGLTVNLSVSAQNSPLPLTHQIERTTPLFDVGKKVDISDAK